MRAIIFAGGVGTRLWPLSRKKSPKQFEKLIGDQSTLQLTAQRLMPEFKPEDIYVSTGTSYIDMVAKQLPSIPKENIICEPVKRDVGPAVAFAVSYVHEKTKSNEPVVILWSDHMVKKQDLFKQMLLAAEKIVKEEENRIVFIGQKPRFASENLGWIQVGDVKKTIDTINLYAFDSFKYRPAHDVAQEFFTSGKHCWNLGYFVTTPQNLLTRFKTLVPEIYDGVTKITSTYGTPQYDSILAEEYEKMPVINFDNALLEQLREEDAYVIVEDIGWSDVGAWEALKEALETHPDDNVQNGNVMLEESVDNLVYNYEEKKLVIGIDLKELLVINTPDVLLITHKSSVGKIKKLVETFDGTKNEKLT